jgi:uncharacterized membrane protein
MIDLSLKAFVLMASIVIVIRAEPALNRMTCKTPLMIRLAFYLLTMGALAEVVFILAGEVPTVSAAILSAGVATMLYCERCLRILCPPPRRGCHEAG